MRTIQELQERCRRIRRSARRLIVHDDQRQPTPEAVSGLVRQLTAYIEEKARVPELLLRAGLAGEVPGRHASLEALLQDLTALRQGWELFAPEAMQCHLSRLADELRGRLDEEEDELLAQWPEEAWAVGLLPRAPRRPAVACAAGRS